MKGVNQIIIKEIRSLLTATGETQKTHINQCGSLVTLEALKALVDTGDIGVGAKAVTDIKISKKAFSRLSPRIKRLALDGGDDDILDAVEADEGMKGVGLLPDQDAPEGVSDDHEGSDEGEDADEPVADCDNYLMATGEDLDRCGSEFNIKRDDSEDDEEYRNRLIFDTKSFVDKNKEDWKVEPKEVKAPEPKREKLSDLKTRYVDVFEAGGDMEKWLVAEAVNESNHPDGIRKGVKRFLDSKTTAMIRKRSQAASKESKDNDRSAKKREKKIVSDLKKAKKAEGRKAIKAERAEEREIKKVAKAIEREAAKAKRAEEREEGSKFFGLPHLASVGLDLINMDDDKRCPRCNEMKPLGTDFGTRVMRRILDEIVEGLLGPAGEKLYRKVVEVIVKPQSQCKKCRGKKPQQTVLPIEKTDA